MLVHHQWAALLRHGRLTPQYSLGTELEISVYYRRLRDRVPRNHFISSSPSKPFKPPVQQCRKTLFEDPIIWRGSNREGKVLLDRNPEAVDDLAAVDVWIHVVGVWGCVSFHLEFSAGKPPYDMKICMGFWFTLLTHTTDDHKTTYAWYSQGQLIHYSS